MLTRSSTVAPCFARAGQKGYVLIFALIMLVAMTIGGLALIRSVDTAILITGNMAMQQAAINAADQGTEYAANWLQSNNTGSNLFADNFAVGYAAHRQDPASGQTWDSFWSNTLKNQRYDIPGTDAAGNAISIAIQRLCDIAGDPTAVGTGCAVPQTSSTSASSSKGAGVIALQYTSQIYYRVTTRVSGPRNTVSYVQAVLAQ